MIHDYQPIWAGLDPENRNAELRKVLLGSVFAGLTEWWGDEGMRPLLVFEKADWGALGLACAEGPQVGHAGSPWSTEPKHLWEEAQGRTVTWVGPGVMASNINPPGNVPALLAIMDDMGIAITGAAYFLKRDDAPEATS